MRLLLDWLGGFRVGVALGRRAPRLPVDDYRSRRPRRCAGLLRQRLGSDPRPRHQRQPRRLAAVPAPARGRAALAPRGIEAEQVLLRTITLPPLLTAAIQEKLQAEQQAQRMRFVLDRERQEAERKRVEAQGIADFQAIVASPTSCPRAPTRRSSCSATKAVCRSSSATSSAFLFVRVRNIAH